MRSALVCQESPELLLRSWLEKLEQRGRLDEALDLAEGRMKKKILATQEAIAGGVPRVGIADGRVPHPVSAALAGHGTWIG